MTNTYSMQDYLEASEYIDIHHPLIQETAKKLALNLQGDEAIAKSCFEFVRDSIKHSWDFQLNPVTCKASQVLQYGTGYCYAKSHLLAALLRANNIPAGLCYQRLTIENDSPPFCLHGLNAIYLNDFGWYRVDARGNKAEVNAQFSPPQEQLAFPLLSPGELDMEDINAKPLPQVVLVLTKYNTFKQVAENLPDINPC